MMSITCPHCGRVGSLKTEVPVGTRVRCPGCQERFEVPADPDDWEAGETIELVDVDDVPDQPLAARIAPLPDSDFDGIVDAYDPSKLAPSAAIAHLTPLGGRQLPNPLSKSIPPEPWFYRWLEGLAKLIWEFTKVALVLVIILVVVFGLLITLLSSGDFNPYLIGLCLYVIVGAALSVLPAFLGAALLMLAVDVARNIRATRYE